MSHRIEYVGDQGRVRQKQPRQKDKPHLAFVRSLSCVVCGKKPVDPMHLRAGNRLLGKRAVGVGEKPDDRWVISGCRAHHDEQHGMNELEFWASHHINPFQLALALYAASVANDLELAESIVAEHRILAMIG